MTEIKPKTTIRHTSVSKQQSEKIKSPPDTPLSIACSYLLLTQQQKAWKLYVI